MMCSAKKYDKNGNLLGFVPHTYFVFLICLLISVPCLEVLFFINHYFLVCILSTARVCAFFIENVILILG